ncbi:MAG: hypothetical protein QM535_21245 [Limnohabitans sp.]|nr:hypothetical protein [Limnohabitans sp.]
MSYDTNSREEELKNKIAKDYFWIYDTTKIIGNVDFCVAMHQSQKGLFEQESLLWAEAKKGISDIYNSLVQLILTIGKARTYDKFLPPAMLGAFDTEKIAFIPYNDIHDIFYVNDFNWNVTPSNYETKEFKIVYDKVKSILDRNALLYYFGKDDKELRKFIKVNFIVGKFGFTKTRIDKNNFIVIYNKWLQTVKSTIAVNWDIAKKKGVIDGDFYLADLLSNDNITLKDKLFVVLKATKYELNRHQDEYGAFTSSSVDFNDGQKAHNQFWNKYERPPKEEYWDYIVERRDLLVPQDVRERKGSFFTPQIWVELSQKYLTDVLGEDWQDEYYVWDCAAGTGNLLTGLTNKYNIWASTLDKQDVDVMHEQIDAMNKKSISDNGANVLKDHVFQFDFLNDDFSKLPQSLHNIIKNPKERKKLIIYINPPYAEASSYGIESIPQVANKTKIFDLYKSIIGAEALNELFAQFYVRIYNEIPEVLLAVFSPPKFVTSGKFTKFRKNFQAKYLNGFICRSDTFDNVNGKFPIGFYIWNLAIKKEIKQIETDIFLNDKDNKKSWQEGQKKFYIINNKSIADWRATFYCFKGNAIGYMIIVGPSMQSNGNTFITNYPAESYKNKGMVANITFDNLIKMSIYLAVRQCVETTWINNSDQLLYPNSLWEKDKEFQNDCLVFAIFHRQNKITSKEGINHWIPFTEKEINSRTRFESNLLNKFINGKLKNEDLYNGKAIKTPEKLEFSEEAQSVFDHN